MKTQYRRRPHCEYDSQKNPIGSSATVLNVRLQPFATNQPRVIGAGHDGGSGPGSDVHLRPVATVTVALGAEGFTLEGFHWVCGVVRGRRCGLAMRHF